MSFIETWTDAPGYSPATPDDPWAEGEGVERLSTVLPGLGSVTGIAAHDEATRRESFSTVAGLQESPRRAVFRAAVPVLWLNPGLRASPPGAGG